MLDDGSRLEGRVREKTRFPQILNQDGTIQRRGSSRYFVELINRPLEEALVDNQHLVRHRKTFSKQMLRVFIRNTVTRDSWTGAPWLVKDEWAAEFRIPTEIPDHLRIENRVVQEKKPVHASKKSEQEGMFNFWASRNKNLPELKPALKGTKKQTQQEIASIRQEQFLEYQRAMNGDPTFSVPVPNPGVSVSPSTQAAMQAQFEHMQRNNAPGFQSLAVRSSPKMPPPQPVKYPREDLEIPPKADGTHRPLLKYLCEDPPIEANVENEDGRESGVVMESVGPLLETWQMLNVYCEVFQIDSFTFDDYVEALKVTSPEVECELLVEIHCAILKKLVNGENEQNGAVQVVLPDPEDEEEDDSANGGSPVPTPTPEPEVKPVGRTTRSSLAKSEAEQLKANGHDDDSNATDVKVHRAAEMASENPWIPRLRKRDFKNGGWEVILVGLLHQLSRRPRLQKMCEEILAKLAPMDMEPTKETALIQYAKLEINLRVKALQIICMLTMETKAIRIYMEECSNQMTEFRKEKIEWQRKRKAA